MDYRWKVTNTGHRSPGTRVPMVAQILRRNVHVVKSMLSSAAAPPSSVMKSRLFIHVAQRVSGDGGDLRFGASGNGEPRDAGCSSWTLQEPQIERREHQDNSDVHYQPLPEPVPEEQDVHADHDGYQREHVKHDGCLSSHPSFLLRAAELEPERRYRLHR